MSGPTNRSAANVTGAPLRDAIRRACRSPEPECVQALVGPARLAPGEARAAHALASRLAQALRARGPGTGREGLVQGLLQEFALSSQEGIALMCLAEALLRIPDRATRDALIRDKIGPGEWGAHLGQSQSLFVNAATWGLVVTGKLVATHTETGLASALSRLLARSGEPLVRRGVDMAMRLMGEQFVAGKTIDEALANAVPREAQGFRHSYDMLGEAALTDADAKRYLASYRAAIEAIGLASNGRGIYEGPGISIKLSALHPRYSRQQRERVLDELYPRLVELALLARAHDIGVNIDAEEADRLDLSLDLLERLAREAALAGWNGIGFVIQAYQKRCPFVIDFLVDLARRSDRRLMVRLVKGAYWDSEIKRAQQDGLEGYPVYTRKVHTDVAYLACARKLLAVPREIYPQFATHNAYTLAAVHELAGPSYYGGQYEFQCLHGMGEPLYEQVVAPKIAGGIARPCRIYAPVGTHETLLAYLVRRLLENGANTSFVHRIADRSLAIDELVADPVEAVVKAAGEGGSIGAPHPAIALPRDLFGSARSNSTGIDLTDEGRLAAVAASVRATAGWRAAPIVGGAERVRGQGTIAGAASDRRREIGRVFEATADDVADALDAAAAGVAHWEATPVAARAAMLDAAAERMEAGRDRLVGLVVCEAGKTWSNAVGEVREAVDFLRYYAHEARVRFAQEPPRALGVAVCISPWNFPLSIFTGQVAAALAAGNGVLAKPAEQTPLVAAEAVRCLHAAGVPGTALQFLPGRGETVGAALVADPRVRAVLFTGSDAVARSLQASLAGRLDPAGRTAVLIAETGGQNAMIVDSSALAEQAVGDAITSAFDSAGQRCSALRVLCIQDEVADRVLAMLRGALDELRVGATETLATDVGPVIDSEAKERIDRHVDAMRAAGRAVYRAPGVAAAAEHAAQHAAWVAPTLIEIERIGELTHEVFGPVLHVLRYRRERLGALIDDINATGYGLTFGVQSRIDETIDFATARIRAGNVYVNRNMIGATVGVQPFGGDGLSGTGPKAGGPCYLPRLVEGTSPARAASGASSALDASGAADASRASDASGAADASRASDASAAAGTARDERRERLSALRDWAARDGDHPALAAVCDELARHLPDRGPITLAGPTGERNVYASRPREAVLCIAARDDDLVFELAFVLAAGAVAVWEENATSRTLRAALPGAVQASVVVAESDGALRRCTAALVQGEPAFLRRWSRLLAEREGPIIGVQTALPGERSAAAFSAARLRVEQSVATNTAAAGGNASLMTIG